MKRVIIFVFAAMIAIAVSAQVDFRNVSFKEALAAAQNEGKLVFVDCYTEWCGPCKMMATREFVKKEAGDYFNEKFVNFKIDMEKGEGPEMAKKYDVAAYPTFLILEANGDLRGRCVGAAGIEEFIKKVEAVLKEEKGLPWYQKKFKAGERDEAFLKEYVKILGENYMRDELKNVSKTLLAGKSGSQIASDKDLFSAFLEGGFTPYDDLFLTVYKERATIAASQGDAAAKQMDDTWRQYAMASMKFDGKTYQGFDKEKFEAYKQLMCEYAVPDIDGIVKETMINNARYAKDYPTVYQELVNTMKAGGEINDRIVLTDMETLVKEYKSNKKAVKNIAKLAKQRVADLQKKDTSGERKFKMGDKEITLTGYLIEQYQDVIEEAAKK